MRLFSTLIRKFVFTYIIVNFIYKKIYYENNEYISQGKMMNITTRSLKKKKKTIINILYACIGNLRILTIS